MSTITVYPQPGTTVDGYAYRNGVLESWAVIRAGAGTGHNDTDATGYGAYYDTGAAAYGTIIRAIYLFDTSAIGSGNTVTSATFSLYGIAAVNDIGTSATDCAISLAASTPASNTALADSDYGQTGTTRYATDFTFASWSTSGYNTWNLNSTGLAAISLTGISKFATKFACDLDNSAPAIQNAKSTYVTNYFADQAGTTNDPKLVVNYTTSSIKTVDGLAVASVKTVNGLAIGSVKTWNGLQ